MLNRCQRFLLKPFQINQTQTQTPGPSLSSSNILCSFPRRFNMYYSDDETGRDDGRGDYPEDTRLKTTPHKYDPLK